jgi:hypothetical protein
MYAQPLLLVPGLGGSRLKLKETNVFPPNIFNFVFQKNEWQNNVINNTDVHTMEFGDKNSLDLRSVLPFYIRRNYFDEIIKKENTHAMPYDFRFIHKKDYLADFYGKLEKYIESFNQPVCILAHSTGGLLIHWFLFNKSKKWKKRHIKFVINVNVPFGGLFVGLKHLIQNTLFGFILGRHVLRNLGGFIINMPNTNIFKYILTVDGAKCKDFYKFFNLEDIEQKYKENMDMVDSFEKSNGVKTFIVYSSNKETLTGFKMTGNKIKYVYGKGDGVVPIQSLLVPKLWKNKKLYFYNMRNYSHSNILYSYEFTKLIDNLG